MKREILRPKIVLEHKTDLTLNCQFLTLNRTISWISLLHIVLQSTLQCSAESSLFFGRMQVLLSILDCCQVPFCSAGTQLFSRYLAGLQLPSYSGGSQLFWRKLAALQVASSSAGSQLFCRQLAVLQIASCSADSQLFCRYLAVLQVASQLFCRQLAVLMVPSCFDGTQLFCRYLAVLQVPNCSSDAKRCCCPLLESQSCYKPLEQNFTTGLNCAATPVTIAVLWGAGKHWLKNHMKKWHLC